MSVSKVSHSSMRRTRALQFFLHKRKWWPGKGKLGPFSTWEFLSEFANSRNGGPGDRSSRVELSELDRVEAVVPDVREKAPPQVPFEGEVLLAADLPSPPVSCATTTRGLAKGGSHSEDDVPEGPTRPAAGKNSSFRRARSPLRCAEVESSVLRKPAPTALGRGGGLLATSDKQARLGRRQSR